MKATTVRGTPVRSISANNGQGFTSGGKPAGYNGTVPVQYQGDQANKVNPRSGTPYNSASVNDDTAPKSTTGTKMGNVIDTQTGTNLNLPESNGNGVILDGVTQANDYLPTPAGYPDSPVPVGAQAPQRNSSMRLNELRNGVGSAWGATDVIKDSFQDMGGVMSRGMAEGSKG